MPPTKFTSLRAHATTGTLKLPGEEVKRLIGADVMEVDSFYPPKSPYYMHDNTTFERCPPGSEDDDQGLEMILELINNAVDPSERIFTKHRKDIAVSYDDRHRILQFLYKGELLWALQPVKKGFRLLNPAKPFAQKAYRTGNGEKQGNEDCGGGYNYGSKQAARTGVEHCFTLTWEFVGQGRHNKRQRYRSGLGADPDRLCAGCMCAWISTKGGVDSFDLKSSLPLVETIFEIDEEAYHVPYPADDADEVEWEDNRTQWVKERVEWVHRLLFKAICAFEFMYDLDLETPSSCSSPLFGGQIPFYRSQHAHLMHRNRYTPRIKKLWSTEDEVKVPEGFQMVIKLRMYDLTSSRHSACNGFAKRVTNGIMRLPGKGFPTKHKYSDGTPYKAAPIAKVFDNEHRIACSYYTKDHFKTIIIWELEYGEHYEVISAELLPLLRGGTVELLGECTGEFFALLVEKQTYDPDSFGVDTAAKYNKMEEERLQKLRVAITCAAACADAAARGESLHAPTMRNAMAEEAPVLYRSDTADADAPRAQYFANFLDTYAIEVAVDAANTQLFVPSSLNLDAAEKRMALKVKELAAEQPDKYAPPDALQRACAHVYGPDAELFYVPPPEDGTKPINFRHKTTIVIHQCDDAVAAMQGLMEFGQGPEELDRLLDLQAAMSTGKSACWKRSVSDAARALVNGLPDALNKQEGYTSDTNKRTRDEVTGDNSDEVTGDNKKKKQKSSEPPQPSEPEPEPSGPPDPQSPEPPKPSEPGPDPTPESNSVIDPNKIKYRHPLVTGGFKPVQPCHFCKKGKPLTYLKQEPFDANGVIVFIPIEQPVHKGNSLHLFRCYMTFEGVLDKAKKALENAGEWGGVDGEATTFIASYAPDANWGGYWDKLTKDIWINIGTGGSPEWLGMAIAHELAHHNTYGKMWDPHGAEHGAETERLAVIILEYLRAFS